VIAIDCKADVSILHDIEIIPDIPLLDNDRACRGTIGLHGMNQTQPLILVQTGKNEIVRESIVDELDCFVGLGVGWGGEVLGHVEGLGEHILGTLGFGTGVHVDGLFAGFYVGRFHLG
jgi:hypothetical protein